MYVSPRPQLPGFKLPESRPGDHIQPKPFDANEDCDRFLKAKVEGLPDIVDTESNHSAPEDDTKSKRRREIIFNSFGAQHTEIVRSAHADRNGMVHNVSASKDVKKIGPGNIFDSEISRLKKEIRTLNDTLVICKIEKGKVICNLESERDQNFADNVADLERQIEHWVSMINNAIEKIMTAQAELNAVKEAKKWLNGDTTRQTCFESGANECCQPNVDV